jgi:hypothetical protein
MEERTDGDRAADPHGRRNGEPERDTKNGFPPLAQATEEGSVPGSVTTFDLVLFLTGPSQAGS